MTRADDRKKREWDAIAERLVAAQAAYEALTGAQLADRVEKIANAMRKVEGTD